MSPNSVLKQDNDTDPDIGDDRTERPGEFTWLCDIEEDYSDHQQEVLHLGPACLDMMLGTSRVSLPKTPRCADSVIALPLHSISRNPAGAMSPPLPKRQRSSLLSQLLEFGCAPSTEALPLRKSSGDQNVLQSKASADQKVPQHQMATFEVAKMFMDAIIVT